MIRTTLACAALVGALLLTTRARADVLHNKALSTADFGWNSNINGTSQQAADDLVLAAGGVADKLTWFGFRHDGGISANFRLRLFADAPGQPTSLPFYDQTLGLLSGTDTGLDNPSGNSILQYSSAIPPVPLGAGTRYWLMIASADSQTWAWSHAVIGPVGNDQFHRNGDADAWRSVAGLGFGPPRLEQAFLLEGIIPEPGSLTCAGLLVILLGRRRLPCAN